MVSRKNTIAVIACGGKSQRMGIDKSLLIYHGIPQWQRLINLCHNVKVAPYISIREEQKNNFPGFNDLIIDHKKFSGQGPITGLLSAFEEFPNHDILYLGCDYPLLTEIDLTTLLDSLDTTIASAYFSTTYEPLLCIYSSECRKILNENFLNKKFSLAHFLSESKANKVMHDDLTKLVSVDSPEAQKRILEYLNQSPLPNNSVY